MKHVLVTGGAKRIGQAICRRLAHAGMQVVVHANHSMPAAEALAEDIGGHAIQADLSDPAQAEDLVSRAIESIGHLDYVVNNASAFPQRKWQDATYEDVDAMMRLHAWAPAATTRSLAAAGGEAVVNMLDTRINSLDLEHGPYMLSKQALANLTGALAAEFAPMRVNGVAPGPILPATDGSDMAPAVLATTLQRAGTPEEVADAVHFMLTASYTTGDVVYVDGGRHLK